MENFFIISGPDFNGFKCIVPDAGVKISNPGFSFILEVV